MSSYGYRLERSITAIECADDGRSALRVIPEDSIVLVCSGASREGMVRIIFQNTEYEVFEQDLQDRSAPVAVDLRKPAGVCAAAAGGLVRWAFRVGSTA